MKRTASILAAMLLLLALLNACVVPVPVPASSPTSSPDTSTPEANTPEPTEEPELEPEDEKVPIGEMVTMKDWEITIDSVELAESVKSDMGSYTADDGDQYLVATVTIKNIGTNSGTFLSPFPVSSDVNAKVIYQGSYEFSSSYLIAHDSDLHNQSLNPLSSKTGVIVFPIVADVELSDDLVLELTQGTNKVLFSVQ